MQEYIGFCLCHPDAVVPQRQHEGDAGYDLASVEDIEIPPHGWSLVSTGLKVLLPPNTYGRVAPRSGLSCKGIMVGAGVIDASYRGLIKVLLYNHDMTSYCVKKGERIAQMIVEVIKTPPVRVITEAELTCTQRGDKGFGSTDVSHS
jgi:dUTP pyrophosphatase